ncbi:MAG: HpcH/HpaI aldolase family protein [Bacillota bacterium]
MNNKIKKKLQAGEVVVGSILSVNSPDVAEVLSLAGFEFVFIDMEHGSMGVESITNLIRAVELRGTIPLVRVTENTPALILRTLDVGAYGLHVPQINNKQDAEKMVRSAKYSPLGERGTALPRSAGYGTYRLDDYQLMANEQTLLVPHIENIKGVENLQEIVKVPGIDVIFLGPYDLSQSMGIPGQFTNPKFEQVIQQCLNTILDEGLIAGYFVNSVEDAQKRIAQGFKYIVYSIDMVMLSKIAKQELELIKKMS